MTQMVVPPKVEKILSTKECLMIATISLLAPLFIGSGVVWWRLVERYRKERVFVETNVEARAQWFSLPELAIAYIALLWITMSLLPQFMQIETPRALPISRNDVALQAAINFGLTFFLLLGLTTAGRPLLQFGVTIANSPGQMRFGIAAFLASVVPMGISMVLTSPIRSIDHQHSLLKLLAESPTPSTVILIAVTAVLSAPLIEELLFRVILQGWLTTLYRPSVAITVVAILFGLVHGWRDGLALLPLAWILGYVFHHRHSYLTVVVIHALFNATMLALQLLNPQQVATS